LVTVRVRNESGSGAKSCDNVTRLMVVDLFPAICDPERAVDPASLVLAVGELLPVLSVVLSTLNFAKRDVSATLADLTTLCFTSSVNSWS